LCFDKKSFNCHPHTICCIIVFILAIIAYTLVNIYLAIDQPLVDEESQVEGLKNLIKSEDTVPFYFMPEDTAECRNQVTELYYEHFGVSEDRVKFANLLNQTFAMQQEKPVKLDKEYLTEIFSDDVDAYIEETGSEEGAPAVADEVKKFFEDSVDADKVFESLAVYNQAIYKLW